MDKLTTVGMAAQGFRQLLGQVTQGDPVIPASGVLNRVKSAARSFAELTVEAQRDTASIGTATDAEQFLAEIAGEIDEAHKDSCTAQESLQAWGNANIVKDGGFTWELTSTNGHEYKAAWNIPELVEKLGQRVERRCLEASRYVGITVDQQVVELQAKITELRTQGDQIKKNISIGAANFKEWLQQLARVEKLVPNFEGQKVQRLLSMV